MSPGGGGGGGGGGGVIRIPTPRPIFHDTVGNREMGTDISEANKRVPIFPFDTQGGKHVSSYFRQRYWVQA